MVSTVGRPHGGARPGAGRKAELAGRVSNADRLARALAQVGEARFRLLLDQAGRGSLITARQLASALGCAEQAILRDTAKTSPDAVRPKRAPVPAQETLLNLDGKP